MLSRVTGTPWPPMISCAFHFCSSFVFSIIHLRGACSCTINHLDSCAILLQESQLICSPCCQKSCLRWRGNLLVRSHPGRLSSLTAHPIRPSSSGLSTISCIRLVAGFSVF